MSRSFHPTTCKDVIRNSALTSRRAETNDSSLILILRNEAGRKLWGRERETMLITLLALLAWHGLPRHINTPLVVTICNCALS